MTSFKNSQQNTNLRPIQMKLRHWNRISFGALFSAAVVLLSNAAQAFPLTRPQIDLFVLAGQSNMVGFASNVS
ncbi:MAG: hypothetical protein SVX43_22745, partial [Cyanobacteriota bacterium]|nr:hypothetical protein [Cyanobacteriota bacterium]